MVGGDAYLAVARAVAKTVEDGWRYASCGVHNACGYASERMDDAVRAAQRTVDLERRLPGGAEKRSTMG